MAGKPHAVDMPSGHASLLIQAIIGRNLLGRPVPTSIVQVWIPCVDLPRRQVAP
jgi:hypothetical protein